MNTNDVNQLNIDNLISLWKKMGVQAEPEFSLDGLTISHTWPNRFWFGWNATSQQVENSIPLLPSLPTRAVVPVWMGAGDVAGQLEQSLLANRFQVSFQQLAMYLDLTSVHKEAVPPLDINKVQSAGDLQAWTATASAAFGYWIDIAAIEKIATDADVTLLLVKQDGAPVATALVYKTRTVIGVHMVGVPEAYRGRGLARSLMKYVINLGIELGGTLLTLQASAAGEPLYRELGFVPQFLIKNYHRV